MASFSTIALVSCITQLKTPMWKYWELEQKTLPEIILPTRFLKDLQTNLSRRRLPRAWSREKRWRCLYTSKLSWLSKHGKGWERRMFCQWMQGKRWGRADVRIICPDPSHIPFHTWCQITRFNTLLWPLVPKWPWTSHLALVSSSVILEWEHHLSLHVYCEDQLRFWVCKSFVLSYKSEGLLLAVGLSLIPLQLFPAASWLFMTF